MKSGNRALHLAVKQKNKDMVRLLLDNGADIDAKNHKNQTALCLAEKRGMINDIIEAKAKSQLVGDCDRIKVAPDSLRKYSNGSKSTPFCANKHCSCFGTLRRIILELKLDHTTDETQWIRNLEHVKQMQAGATDSAPTRDEGKEVSVDGSLASWFGFNGELILF